ncbi:hypothetical protein [Arthrobacter nitrophenolicus]|uniref:Uncharacterized protein n=1 Tax=Arthrobacter nitrophenolicus TaxID=683150 RepID=A0A4R5XS98_9MICC|nr:hypothetical protein [Arthrobacter nitrophenolicus]TDL33726.1 hypothetical protein E2R57_17650 [Arthrobacter nitrophenolicus]
MAKAGAGRLPKRALVLAGAAAVVVVVLLVVLLLASLQPGSSPNASSSGGAPVGAGGGIDIDSSPVTSEDGLRLTGLQAASGRDPESPGG